MVGHFLTKRTTCRCGVVLLAGAVVDVTEDGTVRCGECVRRTGQRLSTPHSKQARYA